MSTKEQLTRYVRTIVQTLTSNGIQNVVISPGSRSTPLAYGFASTKKVTVYRQIDERSAAYYALGLAKATQCPTVLLCTSGTAASNYLPAITEAYYARVPLIVITADRPHELREVGAPQTIDQIGMYGKFVKFAVDFPVADDTEAVYEYLQTHLLRALQTSLQTPAGPVHLNFPFREPLLIHLEEEHVPLREKTFLATETRLNLSSKEQLEARLTNTTRGLLVIGELPIGFNRELFWQWAGPLGWPIVCDPLSNLRTAIPEQYISLVSTNYDAFLKDSTVCELLQPHCVIRLGSQPVSKFLSKFLANTPIETMILFDEASLFRDPINAATHVVQAPTEAVFDLEWTDQNGAYLERWQKVEQLTQQVIDRHTQLATDEGALVACFLAELQTGVVFSGSSMPIRDLDTFLPATSRQLTIVANRGTNGIDGVVSTALGFQHASKQPTYLVIGDLSFLHDLNGLVVSRFHSVDLTIIVLNNDGGGIFSYLPQAQESSYFEQLFGTPTGLTFESIAHMYNCQYELVRTKSELVKIIKQPKEQAIRIIEIETDRQQNTASHRLLWQTIQQELRPWITSFTTINTQL